MAHFLFDDKPSALAAEALICDNIRSFVAANIPDALTEDGSIRGRRVDTGEYGPGVTSRWDDPRQTLDGRWAIQIPTKNEVAPIPLAVVLAGVTAEQGEPEWPVPPPRPGASL